jgi:hypothetical protein
MSVSGEALDLPEQSALSDPAPSKDELMSAGGRFLEYSCPGRHESLGSGLLGTRSLRQHGQQLDDVIIGDGFEGLGDGTNGSRVRGRID